jgi:hypothetical protein
MQSGATVQIERAVFESNRCGGIQVIESGTLLQASDLVVRDNLPCERDDMLGIGIGVGDDAHIELDRTFVTSNHDTGILFIRQSHGELTDVVVNDTYFGLATEAMGHGIMAQDASSVLITRALLDANHHTGIVAQMDGTEIDLTDVSIHHTGLPDPDSYYYGLAISVFEGATATITRAALIDNIGIGLLAHDPGTSVTASDVTIQDTAGVGSERVGLGMEVKLGAQCSMTRVLVERNHTMGVAIRDEGTSVTLTDAVISNTLSEEETGWWGRGVQLMFGAHLELTRAVLEHNQEMGIVAFNTGTRINGTDVVITDTIERSCATSTCEGYGYGCGVCSMAAASVDLRGFVISDNILCGVQIGHGWDPDAGTYEIAGSIDLHHGVVSGNPIGANVQTSDYDLSRLMDNVLYFDNDRDLDTYDLPIPNSGMEP